MIRLRNTISLQDRFELVSEHDEALDRDAEGFEENWRLYRNGDKASLSKCLKDGEEPTVFELRLIADNDLLARLAGMLHSDGALAAFVECACYAIVSIENGGIEVKHTRDRGFPKLAKSVRDAIPMEILGELGAVVMERSQNPPTK